MRAVERDKHVAVLKQMAHVEGRSAIHLASPQDKLDAFNRKAALLVAIKELESLKCN